MSPRTSFCILGRTHCCILVGGTVLSQKPCRIGNIHYTDTYHVLSLLFHLLFASPSSCGWECRPGTSQPVAPTWRAAPSWPTCRTRRSSGRSASVTRFTASNCGWPSRRWCPSPAPPPRPALALWDPVTAHTFGRDCEKKQRQIMTANMFSCH